MGLSLKDIEGCGATYKLFYHWILAGSRSHGKNCICSVCMVGSVGVGGVGIHIK